MQVRRGPSGDRALGDRALGDQIRGDRSRTSFVRESERRLPGGRPAPSLRRRLRVDVDAAGEGRRRQPLGQRAVHEPVDGV